MVRETGNRLCRRGRHLQKLPRRESWLALWGGTRPSRARLPEHRGAWEWIWHTFFCEPRSGATKHEVLGDGAQATGGVAVGREFRDGLGGEVVGDVVGALQSVDPAL